MPYLYPATLSNSSNFNEKGNGKGFVLSMFHDSCTVDSGRQHWYWSRWHMMAPILSQKDAFYCLFSLPKEKRKSFLGPKLVSSEFFCLLLEKRIQWVCCILFLHDKKRCWILFLEVVVFWSKFPSKTHADQKMLKVTLPWVWRPNSLSKEAGPKCLVT